MISKLTIVAALHGGLFLLTALILFRAFTPPEHGLILAVVFVGLGGFFYLLPAYIAALRNAPRFAAIFGLNLFAGWTGFGWLATLIWSFVDIKKDVPQVIIQQVYPAPGTPGQPPQTPPPAKQTTDYIPS